jgi:hypothetical protein
LSYDFNNPILAVMKKSLLSFLLIISVIYYGCEKDFDTAIDQSPATYQVTGVRTIDSVSYIPGDSLVLITITFNQSQDLRSVFTDIYSSDGSKMNQNLFSLLDNGNAANGDFANGDNTYSNKFPLSQLYPNGIYTIKYFSEDKNNSVKQVAIQNFKFNNGQANIAPIISNDVIEPDTLVVTDIVAIQISIKAEDQNGLNDIETVYFVVYRPDGTSNNIKLDLFDSGNITLHGDLIQGDGVYSLKIQVDQNNMKGTYRFEFQARDRGKKLSNIINHSVLIQ